MEQESQPESTYQTTFDTVAGSWSDVYLPWHNFVPVKRNQSDPEGVWQRDTYLEREKSGFEVLNLFGPQQVLFPQRIYLIMMYIIHDLYHASADSGPKRNS